MDGSGCARKFWTIVADGGLVSLLFLGLIAAPCVQGPAGWAISPVDGGTGNQAASAPLSMALDHAGRPHIAYGSASGLRYASWTGFSWQYETIDSAAWLSYPISLKLDKNESPHVAYGDEQNEDLKYARKDGGSWTVEVVDSYGDVGYWTSLALDSLGQPHITYHNVSNSGANSTLKYAVRDNGTWKVETLWELGSYNYGYFGLSLALNSTDSPRIAFTGWGHISYAHLEGASWRIETVQEIPGQTGDAPSMVLDSQENPHISFSRVTPTGRLEYATRGPLGWVTQTVELDRGTYSGIALDSQNRPHIAYTISRSSPEPWAYLYYAKYTTSVWSLETIDTQQSVDEPPSIAIDGCDGVHVAYWHYTPGVEDWVRYAYGSGSDSTPSGSEASHLTKYWHNLSPASVAAVAFDSCSGVANVTLMYRHSSDNSTWGTWTTYSTLSSPPWVWSFPFPAGEGYYQFYTTSVDNAGNAEPTPAVADAIAGYDATPPVSAALPISPYWHTIPSLSVNAIAADNLSGVVDVTLLYSHAPLDNSTWSPWTQLGTKTTQPWSWPFSFPDGEGNYKFHTIAKDAAGNMEGGKDYAEAVAGYRTPPDYVPVNPLPSSPVTVGLSLSLQLSIDVLNSGGFENVNATLAFHNESSPSSPFFTAEIPLIPAGSTSGPFTAMWTSPATPCACHVVANVDYYDNVTESNETNNTYTWTVNVIAGPMTYLSIGNPNYTSTVTYVKSTTSLNFSVFDQSGLGIRNTTYTIDGGAPVNYTAAGTFFLTGEGEHTVNWRSLDWAGNLEDVSSKVLRLDDIPPATTLSIGDPRYLVGGNFVTSSTPLTLLAVDGGVTPVGLDNTEYRIDGGNRKTYSSSFSLAGEGAHVLEYRSRDLLGNGEAVQSIPMVVDDTPPATAISIGEPKYLTGGNFVKSSTPLALSAADGGVGSNSTFYRLWDGSWSQWRGYSSSFNLAGRDGTWYVEFLSFDYLGNMESVQNETLILDDTPPVTTISPAAPFTLVATDSGCGVNVTMYRIDGGSWTVYSGDFTLPEGEHNITYYSNDMLNNTEVERWLVVTVQGQPPPPELAVNYKPVVALVFAIILAVAGLWSSKKRPWKGGKDRMAVAKAFMITSLPFVIAEAATGIVSLLTGELSMPPLLGMGTAVDVSILVMGLVVATVRMTEKHPSKARGTTQLREH